MRRDSLPGLTLALASLTFLLAPAHLFGQGPPTIVIDSVTPAGPWFPGDTLNLAVKVTYTDAPFPGRVDFVVREVAEAGAKEAVQPANRNVSIGSSERNATKTLNYPGYIVPRPSCMDALSTTTPRCPLPTTMADTLTRLSKIQIVARLFAGAGTEPVATSIRNFDDLTYHEVSGLSVETQPLNTERVQRVIVNGAKFTQATSVGVAFHKAGAADIAIFGGASSNPAFNRPCKPPDAFAETLLGTCDARIINDTTIEFILRTFFDPGTGADPELDPVFEKFLGAYDLLVSWQETAPSADFNFRQPSAVLLGAYTLTAPPKDDLVEIKKLTLTQNSPTKVEAVFEPGGSTLLPFASNATVDATVEFDYKLSRRLGCQIWLVPRKAGQPELLGFGGRSELFNTLGQVVRTNGAVPPRQPAILARFQIPADATDLEFTLVMTEYFSSNPDQNVFATSPPLVVSRNAPPLPSREVQVWQQLEIPAATGNEGAASFKVEFVRIVGSEIRVEAEIVAIRPGFITVRVPPGLLGPANVTTPPLGVDANVRAEVLRASNRAEIARQPLTLRMPQPMIVDEMDVRANSVGLRTLSQFLLNAAAPNIHTFSYIGYSADGLLALRVLNSGLGFPAPLRFETEDVVVFEPGGPSGRLQRIGAPFHIPNLGSGNQGVQFTVSQTGLYVFAVEPNATSPGPFPAHYQFHLAGNVGLPRKLINGANEAPRGTRLDTLFNHPAPRPQSLVPGDIGVARTALFKFANAASISQFARAVLIPPAAGFSGGMRIVRATDPTTPLEITTPTARTPDCAAPAIGTVIDFTQVPDPASVVDPSPALSETFCAVLGENDGKSLTLPKTLPGGTIISSLILDMGSGGEIVDGVGADFEVLAPSGSYSVRIGNTPYVESFSSALGPFSGLQQIDLATAGLKSARYVWITAAPEVVLDAVQSLNLYADEISPTIGPITHVTSATITARRSKDPANPLDPFIQLISPNGDLFGENEAGFGDDLSQDLSDAALVNRILPQDGFYRYLVKGFDKQPDNQSSGTFFTRLETSGNYDQVELLVSSASENQTIAQKTGAISATRQRDSFLFQAAPGTTLSIVVNAMNSPAGFDPMVELYDAEDFLIAANDNGRGRGKNSALLNVLLPPTVFGGAPAPNPSTYRVVVSAIDDLGNPSALVKGRAHMRNAAAGSYELKVFTGASQVFLPQIASLSAAGGPAGTTVIITGANFSSTPSENIVRFGNLQANVISATPTEIVTLVPTGAPLGALPLTVIVSGQTSTLTAAFTVSSAQPPPLSISFSSSTLTLVFTLIGQPGTIVDLEATTSLVNTSWLIHSSITLGATPEVVQLPLPTEAGKFYRARFR